MENNRLDFNTPIVLLYVENNSVNQFTIKGLEETTALNKLRVNASKHDLNGKRVPILARVKEVSRNEYYKAEENGYRLSKVYIINSFEYDNQVYVVDNEKTYKIVRTYNINNNLIELSCEEADDERLSEYRYR